jgi:hypothetical protein
MNRGWRKFASTFIVSIQGFDVRSDVRMDEHRVSPRRRTLKQGKAVLSDTTVLDCMIRDMSETGARLEFGGITQLSPEFRLLVVSSNLLIPVELRWQRGPLAGVAFTGPGKPPTGRI